MKTILPWIVCLMLFSHFENGVMAPAMALEREADPVINLTVKDEPLADVLDTISQETGYQFHLSPEWQSHPVSATIIDLPLEKGLKRLLKSLNHTIIWESDDTIVIKVFGKSEIGNSGNAISFSEPPMPEPGDMLINVQGNEEQVQGLEEDVQRPEAGVQGPEAGVQGHEEGDIGRNDSLVQDNSSGRTNDPAEEQSNLNIAEPDEERPNSSANGQE